jgi:hypothetical protein
VNLFFWFAILLFVLGGLCALAAKVKYELVVRECERYIEGDGYSTWADVEESVKPGIHLAAGLIVYAAIFVMCVPIFVFLGFVV